MVPAISASISFISFIASTMHSVWPGLISLAHLDEGSAPGRRRRVEGADERRGDVETLGVVDFAAASAAGATLAVRGGGGAWVTQAARRPLATARRPPRRHSLIRSPFFSISSSLMSNCLIERISSLSCFEMSMSMDASVDPTSSRRRVGQALR